MHDDIAKEQLAELLEHYTAGSVLHLLSEHYQQLADNARRNGDQIANEQYRSIEHVLFVTGLGIDAAVPSS